MAVIVWLFLLMSLKPDGDCHNEDPTCKSIRMPWSFPCDVKECGSNVTFDCSWRHLKNLSHISGQIFPNTTELNLRQNAIPLISQAIFSKLSNLTVLDLGWANEYKKVMIQGKAFTNLRSLKTLRLSGIHLENVPGHLPASLKILELSYNHIVSLNRSVLSGRENITQLLLSRNCFYMNPCNRSFTITYNAFENMRKLEHLDLSLNNLTSVPKNLPPSLLELKLETNSIQYISEDDFRGLHQLTHLSIQGNCPRCQTAPFPCVECKNKSLQIHSRAFGNLTALHMLNMGGNSLEKLEAFWFKNMPNLKILMLAFNFLMKTITNEAEWLRCLPKLEVLDLSFNYALKLYPDTLNLSTSFSDLKSLRTLHLEGEVFKKINNRTLEPLYKLKNLSAINLGTNFIITIEDNIFKNFRPLKFIFLAENRLYPIHEENPRHLNSFYHQIPETIPPSALTRRSQDYTVHRNVKEECFKAGNVLVLSRNNIFFISDDQFKGYENIACLNLSHNGFSVALNGSEFSSLPNLTYLDLSYNKIDLAYDRAFKDLPNLEILDLSFNSHYFEAFGVSIILNFTLNLPVLRVLNMSHNKITSLKTKQMYSESISELQFSNNNLGDLWKDKAYYSLFTSLTNLSILDISSNNIKTISPEIYDNLPKNLTQLYINKNGLKEISWENLKVFQQLQILDLSYNFLSNLTFKSDNVPALKVLDVSFNHLVQLVDNMLANGSNLKTLYLNNNRLTIINGSTFASHPEDKIETLYIHSNPFECTCESSDFIQWIEKSNIKIPQLTTEVKCVSRKKSTSQVLIEFDTKQCDSDAFTYYLATSSFIFVFIVVTLVFHLFYWDAFYILHLLKAKLKGYRSLNSPRNIYDVFVTYDTKDPNVSDWVMEKLLEELEEDLVEQHNLVCLEERDWFPGTPLLENLTYSIRNSRKTLFVLTKDYVKTGMFKLAMYLAHQRLLDESVDVILVLMLEPVLQHSHFLRLRRQLCGQTVLEWPRNAAAESWFWQNLKNIIKVDNEVLYNKKYIQYFTNR